jgi:hypothetical protein
VAGVCQATECAKWQPDYANWALTVPLARWHMDLSSPDVGHGQGIIIPILLTNCHSTIPSKNGYFTWSSKKSAHIFLYLLKWMVISLQITVSSVHLLFMIPLFTTIAYILDELCMLD